MEMLEEEGRPRACGECAKAKAKCSLTTTSAPGTICARCSRLNKQCAIQNVARKRQDVDRDTPTVTTPAKRRQLPALDQHDHSDHAAVCATPDHDTGLIITHGSQRNDSESRPRNSLKNVPTPATLALAQSDASAAFQLYKVHMSSNFPFVPIIEPDVETLRSQRPFLCKTVILAASNKDVAKAALLEEDVIKDIGEIIIIRGERNLQLLQGLLVLISFYHFHHRVTKQITTFMHLAVSIVAELGLNQLPKVRSSLEAQIRDWEAKGPNEAPPHTMDEMRAYAACYWLSSVTSIWSNKLDSLKSSFYLDTCCAWIEDDLTHLVRVERIRESISVAAVTDALPHFGEVYSSVKLLQARISDLKACAPSFLPQHDNTGTVQISPHVMQLQYLSLEVQLYESALTVPVSSDESDSDRKQRVKCLTACLFAIKAFFSVWISMPPQDAYHLPCACHLQAARALLNLAKLSVFQYQGWELDEARSILSFSSLLEELGRALERAIVATGASSESHAFARFTRPLMKFKSEGERTLESTLNPDTNTARRQDFDMSWFGLDDDPFNFSGLWAHEDVNAAIE